MAHKEVTSYMFDIEGRKVVDATPAELPKKLKSRMEELKKGRPTREEIERKMTSHAKNREYIIEDTITKLRKREAQ